jgi:hypothetical protein
MFRWTSVLPGRLKLGAKGEESFLKHQRKKIIYLFPVKLLTLVFECVVLFVTTHAIS